MIIFLTVFFTILYILMGVGVKRLAYGKIFNADTGDCFTENNLDLFILITLWPVILLIVSIKRGADE